MTAAVVAAGTRAFDQSQFWHSDNDEGLDHNISGVEYRRAVEGASHQRRQLQ